jgi:hypothetical protein
MSAALTDSTPADSPAAPAENPAATPLCEYCGLTDIAPQIDRSRGILRGVKLLGLRSQNGRVYLPEALAGAVGLYEGTRVNVNHPKGHPRSPRDYQDRIGTLRSVAARPGEGLFGDFHFNPRHALAEQLLWDAANAPRNVGFSHNVEARLARREGQWVVEAIDRVVSVDLVADPATTAGLFEQAAEELHSLSELTSEQLRAARPDLVAALLAESQAALAAELEQVRSERDALIAESITAKRRQQMVALLDEHHLPLPDSHDAAERAITSAAFVGALLEAPDEATMRRFVVERAQLVEAARAGKPMLQADGGGRPIARPPREASAAPLDTQAFVRALRG